MKKRDFSLSLSRVMLMTAEHCSYLSQIIGTVLSDRKSRNLADIIIINKYCTHCVSYFLTFPHLHKGHEEIMNLFQDPQ